MNRRSSAASSERALTCGSTFVKVSVPLAGSYVRLNGSGASHRKRK